jgi:hypothetical protein
VTPEPATPEAVTPQGEARPEAAKSGRPARTAIRAGLPRALLASRAPLARQLPAELKAGRTGRRVRPAATAWTGTGRTGTGRTRTGRPGTAAACSRPKTAARAWKSAGTAIRAARRMPNRTVPSPTLWREQGRNAPPDRREERKADGRKPGVRTPRRTDRPRPSRNAGSCRRRWPRTARTHGASRACRPDGTANC